MAKIALLGGAFDPIHKGHLALADYALRALKLDQVRFIPCASPVHKALCTASALQRAAMIRLAIASQPLFVLDTIELDRKTPSYAIDTIEQFIAIHGADHQLYWLMGADALLSFKSWRRWSTILTLVDLVVVNRSGCDQIELDRLFVELDMLARCAGHGLHSINMPPQAAASRIIRTEQASLTDLPLAVKRYIDSEHLYRGFASNNN